MLGDICASKSKFGQLILSYDDGTSVDQLLHGYGSLVLHLAHFEEGSVAATGLHALEVVKVFDSDAETGKGPLLGRSEVQPGRNSNGETTS